MMLSVTILAAVFLGFVPPLLWLWFWLKEDVHPEPRREIMLVFSIGMMMVLVAYLAEKAFGWLNQGFVQPFFQYPVAALHAVNLTAFAFIEETAKMGAALISAFRSHYFDEPIDAMIYLITAALGFAAFENVLFIAGGMQNGVEQSLVIAAYRFANAVLIHASAAAIIGSAFAFSFYDHRRRAVELLFALAIAVTLHVSYNFFVMGGLGSIENQIRATGVVGIGAAIALILFERAKRIRAHPPLSTR